MPHWPGPGPAGSYLAPWKFPAGLEFTGREGEHIEDRMADEALAFLRKNKDRPFYLNYWAFSVHGPWQAKEELVRRYNAKVDPDAPQRSPIYAAMVQSLDEAVGRLLDTLDELGLTENTIVVFFSDNGGVHWLDERMKKRDGLEAPPTSSAPLRGGKATIYEGGTRVPCAVIWPGRTRSDTTTDALLASVDFYPTIIEMLGLERAEDQKFDGVSQVRSILGQSPVRNTAYCFFPHYIPANGNLPGAWVRQGRYKLIRFFCDNPDQTDRFELYDLEKDIGESNNLAPTMPEKVAELDRMLARHLEKVQHLIPRPNPEYDSQAAPPRR